MGIENSYSDIVFLVTFRKSLSDFLPIHNNLVVFDILMYVLNEYFHNRQLTVKSLFHSIPLSHTGFRYYFKQLVGDGWIVSSQSQLPETDRRTRYIKPTEKLIFAVQNVNSVLHRHCEKMEALNE